MLFKNRLIILAYHRIIAETDTLYPEDTTAKVFDAQLAVLSRFFRVFTLSEAVARLDKNELPARSIVITFDDGYEDNASVALPLLERHGLKATFFIATGFINGELMWNDKVSEAIRNCRSDVLDLSRIGFGNLTLDGLNQRRAAVDSLIGALKYIPEPTRSQRVQEIADASNSVLPDRLMMSDDQLKLLAKAGMEIGAHTVSHPILAKQTDSDAESEIKQSRKYLQDLLDAPIECFAYPNGRRGDDYNQFHVESVRRAGFTAAVATDPGCVRFSSDRFQLPRYGVWDNNSAKFAARLCRLLTKG